MTGHEGPKPLGKLVIPAEKDGYKVTSIGSSAFSGCTGITSVTIPNSVTSIGRSAFIGCSGLTSIEIPNSVTSIGDYAFEFCSSLTSVTIPNSVTSIERYAFSGCSGLKLVSIPNSVTSIRGHAFSGCSGLTSVTIPNSVTSIGDYAFQGCSGLTKAEFASIESLCSINFRGLTSNPLFYAHELYIDGKKVSDLTIPNTITSIGDYAFSGCTGLTKAEFASIESLCSIKFGNNDSNPLHYTHELYIDGEKISDLIIPNSVTSIGDYAFSGCSGLSSVTIPNSVTSIGEAAFYDCSGLTSIDIPDSVTSIGGSAFYVCTGLTSVTIPNSVTYIGNSTFSGCTGLTSIDISNSVTYIGEGAFSGCSGLTAIEISNSVTYIGWYAFYKCSGLISVTIPNSVTSIGDYAFFSCTSLTTVIYDTDKPVEGSDNLFSDETYSQATLYTSCPSDKLASVLPWCLFKNVSDISAIEDISADDDTDEPVEIYTLTGIRVTDEHATLTPGIYIERRGSKTRKIAIR